MDSSSRPATGYPAPNPNGYSAPPPYQNYPYGHHQNYQNTPTTRPRATLLRRVLASVIALAVAFAAAAFILWLVLRPKLPQFRVDTFSLSNFTVAANTSLLSLTAQARLTARNPNSKMTLSYDTIETVIFYKSSALSDTVVPPFQQGTKSETNLTANFAAAGSFVDRHAVDGINGERGSGNNNNGNVRFNLRLLCRVRFKARAWRTRSRILKVFCVDLPVGIPSNGRPGTLAGGPRQCRVWI